MWRVVRMKFKDELDLIVQKIMHEKILVPSTDKFYRLIHDDGTYQEEDYIREVIEIYEGLK